MVLPYDYKNLILREWNIKSERKIVSLENKDTYCVCTVYSHIDTPKTN